MRILEDRKLSSQMELKCRDCDLDGLFVMMERKKGRRRDRTERPLRRCSLKMCAVEAGADVVTKIAGGKREPRGTISANNQQPKSR